MATEDRATIAAEKAKLRNQLITRLLDEGENGLALKLQHCGEELPLVCTCCGQTKIVHTRCDQKWCPSCQHALAARTVERFQAACKAAQWPLSVTFTVIGYSQATGIRELRRAWARFRRLRWFRRCTPGGALGFEVTKRGKTFHYHAHAFLDCRWLSVTVPEPRRASDLKQRGLEACKEVAEQWSLATRRKASVKVRRIYKRDGGDVRQALAECFKYSIKGSDLADATKIRSNVGDIIRAICATRMVTTFGTFFGRAPKRRKQSRPCEHCHEFAWLPEKFVPKTRRRK